MTYSPRYPVYVISKGRWRWNLTAKALDQMGVPYRLVVEPQEADDYAAEVDPSLLLVTPFSNLGQGSIPVRNFVWDHAQASGAARHWVLDDNIAKFYRLNRNARTYCKSGGIFAAAEDFVDRYENVGLAGMQYSNFAHDRVAMPPFRLNTRIYSCILIDNALPFRWRGRYNEDTDLSLRVLKSGLCTVLFNAFLIDKTGTMRMEGGNTDELYQDNGRELMAESLREQHPDVTEVVEKWGRKQHHVDYRRFSGNKLLRKADVRFTQDTEYGMVLRRVHDQPLTVVGTPR
jgi:hypothetical protein